MSVERPEVEPTPDGPAALELSVVVPAYNEERRLPSYLDQILPYLEAQRCSFEVIVVDDGSTDTTASIVEQYMRGTERVRLVRLPGNRGKGCAVRTGMLQALGSLRLFADADGATPITELERLRHAIRAGADVAIGSRALHDKTCSVQAHWYRKVIGRVFSSIVKMLTVRGIKDTQCGFKLFTAECANAVFALQRIDDFGFDVEILFIASRKGCRIAEVPVNWSDKDGSKVRLVRDSARMFLDLFKVRLNQAVGLYRCGAGGGPRRPEARKAGAGPKP